MPFHYLVSVQNRGEQDKRHSRFQASGLKSGGPVFPPPKQILLRRVDCAGRIHSIAAIIFRRSSRPALIRVYRDSAVSLNHFHQQVVKVLHVKLSDSRLDMVITDTTVIREKNIGSVGQDGKRPQDELRFFVNPA